MALQAAPETVAAPTGRGRSGWRDWWPALRYCLMVFLYVRIGLFIVGLLGVALLPINHRDDVPGWPARPVTPGWHNVFTAWERFDALWYLRIASAGYRKDDGSAAFFPLYPLLTRAVAIPLGHHWLLAAYLVSNVSLVVALLLLYRLTEFELGTATARRTVVYLCVFPTGFFLFAPYTESLFLALAIGCVFAARRSRWALSGVLGALAAVTRSPGVALAGPIVVEAVLQLRADPAHRVRRAAAAAGAAALVPLGLLAYLGYWWHYGGDWRRPIDLQKSTWSKQFSTPWHTLWRGLQAGTAYIGEYPGGYHTLDLLIVVVVLIATGWVLWSVRLTYGAYALLNLVPPLLLAYDPRPLLSVPRFYLLGFPALWAFARWAERWRAHDLVVAASAGLAGLMSLLFVNWYDVF